MNRRHFFQTAAFTFTTAAAAAPAKKPNLIVIIADDLGYSDIGCFGGEIQTPNLDALASSGLRFTQMYSTARCWPSRSCLLTGYYAQQVGRDPVAKFPDWARFVPQYLNPAGYRCYHSGKWHVQQKFPIKDGGFARSYRIEDHNRNFNPQNHFLDDKALPAIPAGTDFYTTTHKADRSLEFLKQHQAEHAADPFFLYLAFTCPHFPLHAPAADIAEQKGRYDEGWDVVRQRRYERMRKAGLVNCALPPADPRGVPAWNAKADELAEKIGPGEVAAPVPWSSLNAEQKAFQARKMEIHAAMVARMDKEIGRVLEQVRAMGAWDNTMVMFVSDNGASAEQIIRGDGHDKAAPLGSAKSYLGLGPGWSTAANTPFRLHKSWNHEGGISSPCVVHWPAGIRERGKLRHNPAHFIDILPTLTDLAGAQFEMSHAGKTPPAFPGRSLRPAFAKDQTVAHDYLFFHHMENRGLRVGDWKISSAGKRGEWEMYNLRKDRGEAENLAARHPERLREYVQMWERAEKQFQVDNAR